MFNTSKLSAVTRHRGITKKENSKINEGDSLWQKTTSDNMDISVQMKANSEFNSVTDPDGSPENKNPRTNTYISAMEDRN